MPRHVLDRNPSAAEKGMTIAPAVASRQRVTDQELVAILAAAGTLRPKARVCAANDDRRPPREGGGDNFVRELDLTAAS